MAIEKQKIKTPRIKVGTKRQVWSGVAEKTPGANGSWSIDGAGGLTIKDLMQNKNGKVVSKKMHAIGLRNAKYIGVSVSASQRRSRY